MSLGGKQQTQQTTTNTAPWGPQQQYILDVFSNAQNQFKGPGPEYFQGNAVAGFSPETQQAQQALSSFSTGAGQDYASQMLNVAAFNLGPGLDVGNNPYLQNAIKTAVQPIYQGLTDSGGALQQTRNAGVATGQYGGNRQGIAEGLATARATEQAGNVGAQMTQNAYQQALQSQLSTLLNSGQIMQSASMPAQMLDAVGQQKQNYAQQLINAEMQKWNYEQNLPTAMLQNYANIVGGNFGGTSTGTAPGAKSGGLVSGLGGAATGAALGSMLMPGVGTAVGAGLGGLIGLMG